MSPLPPHPSCHLDARRSEPAVRDKWKHSICPLHRIRGHRDTVSTSVGRLAVVTGRHLCSETPPLAQHRPEEATQHGAARHNTTQHCTAHKTQLARDRHRILPEPPGKIPRRRTYVALMLPAFARQHHLLQTAISDLSHTPSHANSRPISHGACMTPSLRSQNTQRDSKPGPFSQSLPTGHVKTLDSTHSCQSKRKPFQQPEGDGPHRDQRRHSRVRVTFGGRVRRMCPRARDAVGASRLEGSRRRQSCPSRSLGLPFRPPGDPRSRGPGSPGCSLGALDATSSASRFGQGPRRRPQRVFPDRRPPPPHLGRRLRARMRSEFVTKSCAFSFSSTPIVGHPFPRFVLTQSRPPSAIVRFRTEELVVASFTF